MARFFALKDIEIPAVVAVLEVLLGKSWIKQCIKEYKKLLNRYDPNKHNFWAPYFNEFYRWKERRKLLVDIPIPPRVAELANWANTIGIFRKDWDGPPKGLFLTRLKKNDTCKHLLFELVIGLNYFLAGYSPTLVLDNEGGRKPDLILHYSQELDVYIECARRMPKSFRGSDLKILVDDLIRILRDKKEGKVDWGGPRVVAIHVPETINWMDDTLRTTLGKTVYGEFERNEQAYRNVNIVVFSSDRMPEQLGNITSTDILCLAYPNRGTTSYELPADFRFAGRQT